VIYCVVPPELEAELFGKLEDYYDGNPNVTVIVDRRRGADRRQRGADAGDYAEQRVVRDRRRARVPGTFPSTALPGD
jgi:hypothetical protein